MAPVEMNRGNYKGLWFLDSGCSNHMCGDHSIFYDIVESFKNAVRLGNNAKMDVAGKGT